MANFNFNKIILGGRMTADPELKTTQSGKSVVTFNVAVNRRASTDGTQDADFITCTAWDKQAELITKYFCKGACICVVGSLRNRSFTDKNNQKRVVTEVLVQEVTFVDSKNEGKAQVNTAYTPAPAATYIPEAYTAPPAPQWETIANEEELPF